MAVHDARSAATAFPLADPCPLVGELHDGVLQSLCAAAVYLVFLRGNLGAHSSGAENALEGISTLLDGEIDRLREVLRRAGAASAEIVRAAAERERVPVGHLTAGRGVGAQDRARAAGS